MYCASSGSIDACPNLYESVSRTDEISNMENLLCVYGKTEPLWLRVTTLIYWKHVQHFMDNIIMVTVHFSRTDESYWYPPSFGSIISSFYFCELLSIIEEVQIS